MHFNSTCLKYPSRSLFFMGKKTSQTAQYTTSHLATKKFQVFLNAFCSSFYYLQVRHGGTGEDLFCIFPPPPPGASSTQHTHTIRGCHLYNSLFPSHLRNVYGGGKKTRPSYVAIAPPLLLLQTTPPTFPQPNQV